MDLHTYYAAQCRSRYESMLCDARNEMDSPRPNAIQLTKLMSRCYQTMIENCSTCKYKELKHVPFSFCYIRPTGEHRCFEWTGAATEPGWVKCPNMVNAARIVSVQTELTLKEPTEVSLTIFYALDYLLDDFSDGGNFIDPQQAYEICDLRLAMVSGALQFKQQKNCGLESMPHLASLIQRAADLRYWMEMPEDRMIIEHDIALALKVEQ